jgi:hypothetical protein
LKWNHGFIRINCGHKGSQIRKYYFRTFHKCSDSESSGYDILLHKVKFGLLKAFQICYKNVHYRQEFFVLQVSKRYGIRPQTNLVFMYKLREVIKTSESQLLTDTEYMQRFVLKDKETENVGSRY